MKEIMIEWMNDRLRLIWNSALLTLIHENEQLDNGKKIKIGKERKYINHSSMILVLIFDFADTKLILVYKN